jgi:hypothetical protein
MLPGYLLIGLAFWVVGCLPRERAGDEAQPAPSAARTQPAPLPRSTATAAGPQAALGPADPLLTEPLREDFSQAQLSDAWRPTVGGAWKVKEGKLCGRGAHNRGVWLKRRLPRNVRIEFTAVSYSPDGDLKAEFFGDGRSGARGVTYDNATGYLVIFGGWKNSLHVLARLDEHGADRKVLSVEGEGTEPRTKPVEEGRSYRFLVERRDGKALRWSVDGVERLIFDDPQPLFGPGHEHFGFNEWESEACFDDLTITPLPDR